MLRHADKFRQKYQIESSRHAVIKRERIGLNWFKEVPLLAILTRNVSLKLFRLSSCYYVSTIPEKKKLHVTDL